MTTKIIVQPRITKITRIDGRVTKVVRSIAIAGGGGGGGVTQEYVDNGDEATLASANLYADSAANAALTSANAATALVEDDLNNLEQTVEDNLTLSYQYTDDAVTTINDSLALKADLVGGLVPASQLPSFLDDVLEGTYVNTTTFNDEDGNPYTPESNKVYIDTTFNKSYRWSGSIYAPLDEGVVLGETSSTAYRGDRGKTAYDHSQATGNPHGTSFSDLLSQSALFNLVYSAYVIGSNIAIAATDTVGEMLGKLQAQVNAKEPNIASGTTAQYWRGDKTWRSFATDVLNTVLTGFSASTATPVTATDNNLIAIGKLQAQINALSPSLGGGLTFNQSRWIFNDFDSSIGSSVVMDGGYIMSSIGTGTRICVAGSVGTQGILRFISAAGADTGYHVSNSTTVPNLHIRPQQGSCCLFILSLPSTGSSRLMTVGFDATIGWSLATMPTNSVHAKFTISSSTVSASCRRAIVGTTTTQGSLTLTNDVYHVFLVQYVADDQVRFVIWNLLTRVKVFDETITTNVPTTATGATLFHGVHATGSGTQALVDIDYIGRGIELPPYFVIPA